MTKNLDQRKYELIQKIITMADESAISKIEDQFDALQKDDRIWHVAIKPLRKTISLEEMKKEQNYAPVDRKTFFDLADKIGIEESIEELLAMLD